MSNIEPKSDLDISRQKQTLPQFALIWKNLMQCVQN